MIARLRARWRRPTTSELVLGVINLYTFIILIRALISWVSPDPRNPIVRLLVQVTEPVLRPVRRVIPPAGMLDTSFIVVFFVLIVLRGVLAAG